LPLALDEGAVEVVETEVDDAAGVLDGAGDGAAVDLVFRSHRMLPKRT
jgi:hypothetical protein